MSSSPSSVLRRSATSRGKKAAAPKQASRSRRSRSLPSRGSAGRAGNRQHRIDSTSDRVLQAYIRFARFLVEGNGAAVEAS